MRTQLLPDGSYFATRYLDPHQQLETRRVFYEDGRVEAFDDREWWTVCHFSADQVNRAKEAIRASGLLAAGDLTAKGVHDTAALTYSWRLAEATGRVTNWAYPARSHPVFEALNAHLDALEAEAGAEWSLE
jgi:hypothetical protein